MRTTFEVDNLDHESYRIAILARQGFHVYLNGHKIHTYIWWLDKPQYRSILLDEEQTQYLKKGKNVLAVYANDQYSPDSPERYAALDAWIEGITKADQEKLDLLWRKSFHPKTEKRSKVHPTAATTTSAARRSLRRWAKLLPKRTLNSSRSKEQTTRRKPIAVRSDRT